MAEMTKKQLMEALDEATRTIMDKDRENKKLQRRLDASDKTIQDFDKRVVALKKERASDANTIQGLSADLEREMRMRSVAEDKLANMMKRDQPRDYAVELAETKEQLAALEDRFGAQVAANDALLDELNARRGEPIVVDITPILAPFKAEIRQLKAQLQMRTEALEDTQDSLMEANLDCADWETMYNEARQEVWRLRGIMEDAERKLGEIGQDIIKVSNQHKSEVAGLRQIIRCAQLDYNELRRAYCGLDELYREARSLLQAKYGIFGL